ncbi:MAG TPA: DUF1573 domain-containing protein [Flavobacterium sp.]|nr:DUF1573 domain-containing protein [Flavobacterium sp.]
MKTLKITLATFFVFALSLAQTTTTEVTNQTPSELKWNNETFDFGTLTQGKPVSHEFTFKNTTKETVLITNARPSCGCTVADYTKTPIKPGEKGMVVATYNAATPGTFTKTITVTTSDSQVPKSLIIKGKVEATPLAEEVKTTPN